MKRIGLPSQRTTLLLLLLLAGLIRVAAACWLQWQLDHRWHRSFLIEGDANGYWELAGKLARGEPYAIYAPPRYVLRMPGFPGLLATSILLFGEHLFPARLLLSLVGTLACLWVYLLGRRLCDERTALIALALAAVSPVFVGFTPVILSETVFALSMLWSLWAAAGLFAALRENKALPRVAGQVLLVGVATGIACYMKPSWLLAAPVFAVALVLICRAVWLRAALAAAGVLLVTVATLLPWGVRNLQVTGHFTLTTFWLGPSLYDGLNPNATGDSDMRFFDEELLLERMSEYEMNRTYVDRSWEFVRANPGRTLELAGAKFLRFWKPWPNAAQFDDWRLKLIVAAYFVPVLGFSLIGVWQHRANAEILLLLIGPVVYFSLLHLVFVSSLRYRLPAEYPLLVLSAVGLQQVCGRWWPR